MIVIRLVLLSEINPDTNSRLKEQNLVLFNKKIEDDSSKMQALGTYCWKLFKIQTLIIR